MVKQQADYGETWTALAYQQNAPCQNHQSKNSSLAATVLISKLKRFIFEEVAHKDDKLAHTGGHGDERLFSGRAQAQVKLFEDTVMTDRAQSGHVKRAAHGSATAVDSSDSALRATITVVGCHPCQCCRRLPIERP